MNPLNVGTRVHCILYGGNDGVVYAIHGEQKPETVTSLASAVMMGGNASIDIVWENGTESPGLPESIIHSVQWRILPGVANAEEIEAMRAQAVREQQRCETDDRERRARFCAEVDALKAEPEYAHLEKGGDQCSGKLAAKNIRKELKLAFPDSKFSVRKAHHGSVNVAWWDGPTTKEVEAFTNKYKAGSFNGMEDIYETKISPWNTVFGGSEYIFCGRSYSLEFLQAAVRKVCAQHKIPLLAVKTFESGEAYTSHSDETERRLVYDFLEKKGLYANQETAGAQAPPVARPVTPLRAD